MSKFKSSNLFYIVFGLLVLILICVVLTLVKRQPAEELMTSTANEITIVKLQSHSELESCWFAFSGRVFDITRLLQQKPELASKLNYVCGTNQDVLPEYFKKASDLTEYQIGILAP